MSNFDWHARYHQDALDGMLMLTLEERGAYNTILDLIYSRRGPVPDDCRWLSGWMGCSLRKWSGLRAALIVKGKLHQVEHNGLPSLSNERAQNELETQAKLSRNRAETGAKGGRKRAENAAQSNENSDLAQANVKLTGARTKTETEQDITEEPPVTPSGVTAPEGAETTPKKATTRNVFLPESWVVSESLFDFGGERGMTRQEIDDAADEFRDYWRARRDRGARKADWDACFRNRLREVAGRSGAFKRTLAEPDARRAHTDDRRDAWSSVVAKRRAEQGSAQPDAGAASGGQGGGPGYPRLAYRGEG